MKTRREEIMNLIRTTCTVICGAILGSLLAVTASAQPLQQEEEPKPRREVTPPPETRPETAPDSSAKQENAKPEKPEKQNDKESQKEAKPSSESSRSEASSGQNDRGHARPAGKSAHIPDDKFRASFGREHKFKVSKPVIVDNRPQFQYSGYTFVIVDPWPVGWAYTDDCYIDFIDGEYFLFDLLHPGVQVALFVTF
jgi:hypothetical protein